MALRTSFLVALALVGLAAANASAQASLTGNWTLTATSPQGPCQWRGTAHMVQNGATLTGSNTMLLVSGPPTCPSGGAGTIATGTVQGSQIEMTWTDGTSTGSFPGNTGANGPSGTFSLSQGPFVGLTGSWVAVPAAAGVPALGPLALLALVVLLGGAIVVPRWRRTAS